MLLLDENICKTMSLSHNQNWLWFQTSLLFLSRWCCFYMRWECTCVMLLRGKGLVDYLHFKHIFWDLQFLLVWSVISVLLGQRDWPFWFYRSRWYLCWVRSRCYIIYFVAFFVFFNKLFEVGPRITYLLLTCIEYDLPKYISTTFCALIFEFLFKSI